MKTILSFCSNCAVLLDVGIGKLPVAEQVCQNCNAPVVERRDRVEGIFTPDEAEALQNPRNVNYG